MAGIREGMLNSTDSAIYACNIVSKHALGCGTWSFGGRSTSVWRNGDGLARGVDCAEMVSRLIADHVEGVHSLLHVLDRPIHHAAHDDDAAVRARQVLRRAIHDRALAFGEHRGPGD